MVIMIVINEKEQKVKRKSNSKDKYKKMPGS